MNIKEEFVNSIICCSGGKLNEYIVREYFGEEITDEELKKIRINILQESFTELIRKTRNDEL